MALDVSYFVREVMNRESTISSMKTLNNRLKLPDELSGVFLPKDYCPRFDIMFLAEMPSMKVPKNWNGKENYNFDLTARDKFFQCMLVKYGVAGSYCTDIVKKRNIPGRPTEEEVKNWRDFLLKEIAIIKPRLILVVGRRTYETSYEPFGSESTSDYIFHYCSQVPKRKFENRFRETLERHRHLLD
jgi:uracil-DNA glycosylase family 4